MLHNFTGNLLLVGAGKMGGALLAGWIDNGLNAAQVQVIDPFISDEMQRYCSAKNIKISDTIASNSPPAVIVLAVKPQMMSDIAPEFASFTRKNTCFISIAAGVSLTSFENMLGKDARIVRVMPNTPAAIGQGMSVACANASVSSQQQQLATHLMQAVGKCAWIEEESDMDIVTAVSGSGPAYVFLLAECMMQAGIEGGLPPETARLLAEQTVAGAGALLGQSEETATTLRTNVTSPGGTTEAALKILMEKEGMQALLSRAVQQAAIRSRALS